MLPPRTLPKLRCVPDTLKLNQEAVLLTSAQQLIFLFNWQEGKFLKM